MRRTSLLRLLGAALVGVAVGTVYKHQERDAFPKLSDEAKAIYPSLNYLATQIEVKAIEHPTASIESIVNILEQENVGRDRKLGIDYDVFVNSDKSAWVTRVSDNPPVDEKPYLIEVRSKQPPYDVVATLKCATISFRDLSGNQRLKQVAWPKSFEPVQYQPQPIAQK